MLGGRLDAYDVPESLCVHRRRNYSPRRLPRPAARTRPSRGRSACSRAHPVIDGHNDLPWAIRENADGAARRRGLRPARPHEGAHRPRAAARGRGGRAVLVGLRPGRPPGRLRPRAARADRHRPPHDRPLPRAPRLRGDRRRGRAGHEGGADRLAPRDRGRPRDRELARRAARLLRPRRALHDPHPREDPRLGGLRDRRRPPRRPHPLRRGGGARDEPARDAGRPLPRLGRDDGGRAARLRGARSSSPTPRRARSATTRATCPTPSSRR